MFFITVGLQIHLQHDALKCEGDILTVESGSEMKGMEWQELWTSVKVYTFLPYNCILQTREMGMYTNWLDRCTNSILVSTAHSTIKENVELYTAKLVVKITYHNESV